MARVSIRAYKPISVDLYGEFETVDLARGDNLKLQELQKEFEAATTEDAQVDVYAKSLDIRLRAADGGKTKPSTLVKRKHQSGELSYGRLRAFLDDLLEATDPQVALARRLAQVMGDGEEAESEESPPT